MYAHINTDTEVKRSIWNDRLLALLAHGPNTNPTVEMVSVFSTRTVASTARFAVWYIKLRNADIYL